jgi:hydroxyethylthiazole kinase-like uncharacterized protein yjeF
MRIVAKDEMKEIETKAFEEYGFSEALIIENVGIASYRYLARHVLDDIPNAEIIILTGKGNNASDGLAIGRHLANNGYSVRAFCIFPEEDWKEETKNQIKMAKSFGVKISQINDVETAQGYFAQSQRNIIVIDALFGTGVQLPLSQLHYDVIKCINERASFIISTDIPSGIDGDTGTMQGNAVDADLTLAIGLPKLGYYLSDGARHVGSVEVIETGLPKEIMYRGDKFLLDIDDVLDSASRRDKFADKKVFGHTLVLGGSHGLTGALVMTTQSAMKVGAGLVTGATWENQYQEFLARLMPEVMTGYIPMDQKQWPRILREINKYDAIVIGPGLGRSVRSRNLVLDILSHFKGPVVIDADGINVLSLKDDAKVFVERGAPTVLTPHFGEFCRFTDIEYDKLIDKPVHYLKQVMEQLNCTMILKGPCTYIGLTSGEVLFNYSPNDGMATGGVGDVLAGILGGLLGQDPSTKNNNSLFNAYENFDRTVCLGVSIHTLAGKIAAETNGVRAMTATSIIDALPDTFKLIDKRIQRITEAP